MGNRSSMCGKLLLMPIDEILPEESLELEEVANPMSSLSYVMWVTTDCFLQQVSIWIQLLSLHTDEC